jgi:hypothetical protein
MMPMSSRCKTATVPTVSLVVHADSLGKFTTLLQSGFFLCVKQGETIGGLLTSLPGFSEKYITERVQTIFIDGLPADDLTQQFSEEETVLAISAAMPGLAGAIFRKGGIHASLRTATAKTLKTLPSDKPLTVRLKLFNVIAIERGVTLLAGGCSIQSASFEKFLDYRFPLAASIQSITIDKQETDMKMLRQTLTKNNRIFLTIDNSHDN